MSLQKLGTKARQEQIAQAALDVIAAGGLRKLSMATVARRVGLVPSALYRHFKSKAEVLAAAVDLIQMRTQKALDDICEQSPDCAARLKLLLAYHLTISPENEAMERIVFSDAAFSGQLVAKKRVAQVISGYLDRLTGIIRQGQRDGAIRPDAKPATLAIMFVGLFRPLDVLRRVTDDKFDATRHAERAWHIFKDAISTRADG